MAEPLLEVKDMKVHFTTDDGIVKAVDGVSYSVQPGETLGIVGESGSGKSVSSLTVMGLTDSKYAEISGEVFFKGVDLLKLPPDEMRHIRGAKISMIFQDPMTSLHPFYKVGDQIAESIRQHQSVSKKEAFGQAVEMLGKVNIPRPEERAKQFPHEFSGGMRQRAMIAMALALNPDLLIADEPTTALDVTVQAQILDLIQRLQRELDTAIVMITHDLGVVAEVADDIGVMYAGRIVEYADKETIFAMPEHPYTWGLLKSIPRLDSPRGEELVPIPGRPPSLINKPPGCSFHPRCPYVREAHKRIDPQLAPAADAGEGGKHEVACLLPAQTRRALWAALRAGGTPDQALARVDVPDQAVDRDAVGEVLAPAGTEVAEGVIATAPEPAPEEGTS